MKKLIPWLAMAMLLLAWQPVDLQAQARGSIDHLQKERSIAGSKEIPQTMPADEVFAVNSETTEMDHATARRERLNEIDEMDKSALSHSERTALRKERRDLKQELKEEKGPDGVYISVGAAILIVLLIILLI